ncbi:hypothetical protein [Salaquimonas pukyongi]|uniref:hypothetical protein n=1 Tax=Salaquimonas pukyongi TaxID=2712698 RepID=UPI00096BC351|nr:hypothetical protein [Salaquimonas pukyongi]
MFASSVKLLAAITRLLAALFAAVNRSRQLQSAHQRSDEARKAAGYDRLLTALKARRKAAAKWKEHHGQPALGRAVPGRRSSDT